jgi:hypothetical protein
VKRIPRYVAIACVCMAGNVGHLANTDPFDFDYTIIGSSSQRPESVFNDGSQTYIQPRLGQVVTAVGGQMEGLRQLPSQLATVFGSPAIRDADDLHVQIRLLAPLRELLHVRQRLQQRDINLRRG